MDLDKCGCGKPAHYKPDGEWSCNKYFRCQTYKQLLKTYSDIRMAIFEYHIALDQREHELIAQGRLVDKIQELTTSPWCPGVASRLKREMDGVFE